MQEKHSKYSERRHKIAEICREILQNPGSKWKDTNVKYQEGVSLQQNLLYDPKSNLTYCFNRKVASTSWNLFFWRLFGNTKVFKQ